MASCVIVTAIICVLITTVALIVAFATPNWVKFQNNSDIGLCDCTDCNCGLWLHCTDQDSVGSIDDCTWYFSNDFLIEKKIPDWFKAVQGLMSCAVTTSLLSLVIALFSLCCYCKDCNPYQAAGAFITLTFLLVAVATSVFAAKVHLDHDVNVLVDDDSSRTAIYGWSFYVAAGAGGMALLSSILYCCVGRDDVYV